MYVFGHIVHVVAFFKENMAKNIFDRSSEKDGIEIAFLTQFFLEKNKKWWCCGSSIACFLKSDWLKQEGLLCKRILKAFLKNRILNRWKNAEKYLVQKRFTL